MVRESAIMCMETATNADRESIPSIPTDLKITNTMSAEIAPKVTLCVYSPVFHL